MKKATITKEIKKQVEKSIKEFNDEELDLISSFYTYVATYKGNYIYLSTKKYDKISPAARLSYKGDLNKLEFAIYKYSSEAYDPNEDWFPGSQHLDGTVKGALHACNTAYPPM